MAVLAMGALLVSCSTDDPLADVRKQGPPALFRLSVAQPDVTNDFTVTVYPNGTTTEVPTLDLCAAEFASERLRTGRRQVAVVDSQQRVRMSTEAVVYANPDATAQAFKELRDIRANCPNEFRPAPGSGELTRTSFGPAIDTQWQPPAAGIERLAFDVIIAYETGEVSRTIATYLRRGRMLLGVYFFLAPDAPIPAVEGHDSVEGVVEVFAGRLAALPANLVNPG